jgi:hypothetical protein
VKRLSWLALNQQHEFQIDHLRSNRIWMRDRREAESARCSDEDNAAANVSSISRPGDTNKGGMKTSLLSHCCILLPTKVVILPQQWATRSLVQLHISRHHDPLLRSHLSSHSFLIPRPQCASSLLSFLSHRSRTPFQHALEDQATAMPTICSRANLD